MFRLPYSSSVSSDPNDELPPDVRGRGNDGWILGNEIRTWKNNDLHFQAYAVLLEERSKEIAKRLAVGRPMIEPHLDRRCLTCHSSVPYHQMKTEGDRVTTETNREPLYTIGVSCEACHGPGGADQKGGKGWGEVHVVNSDGER